MKRNAFVEAKDEAVQDALSSTAGSAVRSFLSNDLFCIAVMLVSGALTLAGRFGVGKGLSDAFFGLYGVLLPATLCAFLFLRFFRGKRYSEDEKPAMLDAAMWVIASALVSALTMGVELFALDALRFAKLRGFSQAVYYLWLFVTLTASAYLLWSFYKRSKTRAAAFAARTADGLAWLVLFGGIGALAALDSVYSLLLLLDYARLLF